MTDTPLTDEAIARLADLAERPRREWFTVEMACDAMRHLLAEIRSLRAENKTLRETCDMQHEAVTRFIRVADQAIESLERDSTKDS